MTKKDQEREHEVAGTSTPPGSAMDRIQAEQREQEEPEVKQEEPQKNVEVDKNAAMLELDPEPAEEEEPKQVEPVEVIFVPRKDFEARVNQKAFMFRAGVPTRVSRDVAAMLTEDEERGYIRD